MLRLLHVEQVVTVHMQQQYLNCIMQGEVGGGAALTLLLHSSRYSCPPRGAVVGGWAGQGGPPRCLPSARAGRSPILVTYQLQSQNITALP